MHTGPQKNPLLVAGSYRRKRKLGLVAAEVEMHGRRNDER
jgi:hypothetical protein